MFGLVSTLKIFTFIEFCLIILLLGNTTTKGQQNKVSSKLDFDDNEYMNNNDTVLPISPNDVSIVQPDNKKFYNNVVPENTKNATNKSTENSGPKIHGVRITVDTGDSTKESKESVENTDLGKSKKRVGIHTDITFEFTDGGEDNSNRTNTNNNSEDDTVPIFKGHRQKSEKSSGSKKHHRLNPEHRAYDNAGYEENVYEYYPEYYPQNKVTYVGQRNIQSESGTTIYNQNVQGWKSYVPRSWTTESSYPYKYNTISNYHQLYWKPCYCITPNMDRRLLHRNNYPYHQQIDSVIKPTSSLIEIVDGKLEIPFSKK